MSRNKTFMMLPGAFCGAWSFINFCGHFKTAD